MGDNQKTKKVRLHTFKNSDEDTVITPLPQNSTKHIIINNTLKVSKTSKNEGLVADIDLVNSTGNIFIKDQYDGYFKRFYVDNNEFFIEPMSNGVYNDPIRFVESSNIQSEIEEIAFSNLYIAENGVLNFLTSSSFPTNINDIVGFRINSGDLSFKNSGDATWTSLVAAVGGATQLNQLSDVTLSPTLVNNQTLVYDSSTSVFRNSNIVISTDTTPELGGNLTVGSYNLVFNNDSLGLVDNTGNSVVSITDNNTTSNSRLVLQHSSSEAPEITVDGDSADIDLVISSKGNGDIDINSANLDINSTNINLTSLTNLSFSSGFIQKSINTITSLSTDSGIPTPVSSSYNIILLNISGNNGTYYALLDNGINGQSIDIIFETSGTNNIVNLSFTSKVGTGGGLYDTLTFNTAGQGSSMVFLGGLGSRNRWQVLNTGAIVS